MFYPFNSSPCASSVFKRCYKDHDAFVFNIYNWLKKFVKKKSWKNLVKNLSLSHCLGMNYYINFLGGIGSNGFHIIWIFGTHTLYWILISIVIWGCYSQNDRFVQNCNQGLLWYHIRSEISPIATFVTKILVEVTE